MSTHKLPLRVAVHMASLKVVSKMNLEFQSAHQVATLHMLGHLVATPQPSGLVYTVARKTGLSEARL